MNAPNILTAVPIPGLTPDTLGNYLASLGLLRIITCKWPNARCCWRDGVFTVLGKSIDIDAIKEQVELAYVSESLLTYGIKRGAKIKSPWFDAQTTDTDNKESTATAMWRATCAESVLALLSSHISLSDRLNFNPIFGTGGNSSARIFAEGWMDARHAIDKLMAKPQQKASLSASLAAYLRGDVVEHPSYPKRKPSQKGFGWNLASWFSAANKSYNSSTRKASTDGQITPWAMLLACEAFPLLAGSASRQLGSQRKATGAFPFITRSLAPIAEQAVGQRLAEFWAPVWLRPLTLSEITSLFQSGKAEVDGKAALTSAAFASAIIHRGIDSGIQEFRSFTLLRTTSENTFESRLGAVVSIPLAGPAISEATRRILALRDRLPIDTEGTKKRYRGVQGPIDHALLGLAETVGQGPLQAERSWQLIDAVFEALAKVDRNRSYRESGISFERLPLAWLCQLLSQTHEQLIEVRIALALASLRSEMPTGTSKASTAKLPQPFIAYRLGVTRSGRFWQIPKDVPHRHIWSPAGIQPNLVALAKRRLIETPAKDSVPFSGSLSASISDVLHFLDEHTDDQAIATWLERFSLFDWSEPRAAKEPLRAWLTATTPETAAIHPAHFSYAFFRPHFDSAYLTATAAIAHGKQFDQQPTLVAKSGRLAGIVAALDAGHFSTAWDRALASYRAERIPIADFPSDLFYLSNPQRLLAALTIPVGISGTLPLIRRWLSPITHNQSETNP